MLRSSLECSGIDRAGAEDVDANLARFQVSRPCAREGADGGLAGVIYAEASEALYAGDGAIHDDRCAIAQERQGFLNCEESAFDVGAERLIVVLFGDRSERHVEFAVARAGEEDVDLALFGLDGLEEAVKFGQIAGVSLNAGDVAADEFYRFVELILAASGDEDVSPFFNKELCCGECHSRGGCSDNGDFCFELAHSLRS